MSGGELTTSRDVAKRTLGLVILVPPVGDDIVQDDVVESIFPPVRFLVSMARRFGSHKVPVVVIDGAKLNDSSEWQAAENSVTGEQTHPQENDEVLLENLSFPETSLTELLQSLAKPSEDCVIGVNDCGKLAALAKELDMTDFAVCGALNDSIYNILKQLCSSNVNISVCTDCSAVRSTSDVDIEQVCSTDVIGKWMLEFDERVSTPPLSGLGVGDSMVIYNAIRDDDSASRYFHQSKAEIDWQTMAHRGGSVPRLISIQGDVRGEGSHSVYPIYRHPADEQPALTSWSPTSQRLRDEMNELLNEHYNHALVQYYRGGNDYISEHSDKTIDVKAFSNIINLSLGAARTMVLREKQTVKGAPRKSQKFVLPHNSVFVLGWNTNRKFLHSIKQDKRPEIEKSAEEKAFDEERISYTFRSISTFVHQTAGIFGQGSKCKTLDEARKRDITGKENSDETCREQESLLLAFGKENKQTHFDWLKGYGNGFDVVNFSELQP